MIENSGKQWQQSYWWAKSSEAVAMWSCCYVNLLLCESVAMWSCCHVNLLPCEAVAVWSCCHVNLLPCEAVAMWIRCHVNLLLREAVAMWSCCYVSSVCRWHSVPSRVLLVWWVSLSAHSPPVSCVVSRREPIRSSVHLECSQARRSSTSLSSYHATTPPSPGSVSTYMLTQKTGCWSLNGSCHYTFSVKRVFHYAWNRDWIRDWNWHGANTAISVYAVPLCWSLDNFSWLKSWLIFQIKQCSFWKILNEINKNES